MFLIRLFYSFSGIDNSDYNILVFLEYFNSNESLVSKFPGITKNIIKNLSQAVFISDNK